VKSASDGGAVQLMGNKQTYLDSSEVRPLLEEQRQMSSFRFAVSGAVATFALVFGGQQASAQQASGQFYGYASKQAPMPSGQDQYGGAGCHVEMVGCQVHICSPKPCHNVNIPLPPREHPTCQNAYVIESDLPPWKPTCHVTVYRNHYVPIKVNHIPTDVQPVNILVKWREIHYLCDCPPGTSNCPHVPTGSSQQGSPQASVSVPNSPLLNASAPAAPVAPAAPAKRWVWLAKQGVYGYGFQRQDGLWVVDPSSKRPTLPEGQTLDSAPSTAANVTDTASTGS
jgi:hypothetical protein